jgi:fructose-bisphosphate aldolase, class II
MVRVNIGTALNNTFTGSVRGALVDPRRHLASARTVVADTLAGVLRLPAATTTRAR